MLLLLLMLSSLANAVVVEYTFVDGAFRRVKHDEQPSTVTNPLKDVTDPKIGQKLSIEIEELIDEIFQEDIKAVKNIDNATKKDDSQTNKKVYDDIKGIASKNQATNLSKDDATVNVVNDANDSVLEDKQPGSTDKEGVIEVNDLPDKVHVKEQIDNNDEVTAKDVEEDSSDSNIKTEKKKRAGEASISNILKTRYKLKSQFGGFSHRQYVTQRTTPIGHNVHSIRLYE